MLQPGNDPAVGKAVGFRGEPATVILLQDVASHYFLLLYLYIGADLRIHQRSFLLQCEAVNKETHNRSVSRVSDCGALRGASVSAYGWGNIVEEEVERIREPQVGVEC